MTVRLEDIHFLVTHRCTCACDHCFVWGAPDAEQTMTPAQLTSVIDRAALAPARVRRRPPETLATCPHEDFTDPGRAHVGPDGKILAGRHPDVVAPGRCYAENEAGEGAALAAGPPAAQATP